MRKLKHLTLNQCVDGCLLSMVNGKYFSKYKKHCCLKLHRKRVTLHLQLGLLLKVYYESRSWMITWEGKSGNVVFFATLLRWRINWQPNWSSALFKFGLITQHIYLKKEKKNSVQDDTFFLPLLFGINLMRFLVC